MERRQLHLAKRRINKAKKVASAQPDAEELPKDPVADKPPVKDPMADKPTEDDVVDEPVVNGSSGNDVDGSLKDTPPVATNKATSADSDFISSDSDPTNFFQPAGSALKPPSIPPHEEFLTTTQ